MYLEFQIDMSRKKNKNLSMLYYSWTTKSIEQEMNIESFKEESFTYKAIILSSYLELQHVSQQKYY